MNCLKCGKEVSSNHVFCDSCMEDMKKYPVRPDTAVQLPSRKEVTPSKKPAGRRRHLSDQEKIQRLRKANRRLLGVIGVLLVLLVIVSCFLAQMMLRQQRPLPGQNYSTAASTVPSSEAAESGS